MSEIVESKTAQQRLSELHDARKQRREIVAASREDMAPGIFIILDSPPGIGWRLERNGYPTRYLATRELAIAHYRKLVGGAINQLKPLKETP